jgi:hypothetical protein
MLKSLLLAVCVCTFIIPNAHAQKNLVVNPSFEYYARCPDFADQAERATGWYSTRMTPDFLNTCSPYGWSSIPNNYFGHAAPATGNGYAGLGSYWEGSIDFPEYIGTTLLNPLQIGTRYYVTFKVFLAQSTSPSNWCAINKLGALFTTQIYDKVNTAPLFCNCAQVYSNQIITDTLHWTTIQGSFVADSMYKQVSLGRFFDNASTSTLQMAGTQRNAYYYIDDVCVTDDPLYAYYFGLEEGDAGVWLYPNPFEEMTILQFKNSNEAPHTLELFDAKGSLVRTIDNIVTHQVTLYKQDLAAGMYIYSLYNNNQIVGRGKLLIQ